MTERAIPVKHRLVNTETETTESDKRPEPIALVDMDGTLADFDGGMQKFMTSIGSPEEIAAGRHYFQEQDNEPEHIRERRRLIKRQPGFWSGLPPLELGMAVFEHMRRLDFQISILTKAPKHNEPAWSEKVVWCNKHLPMEDGIGMFIGTEKRLVYGKVLFDDWPKYITPWLKRRPRGLVLMPGQPWNEGAFSDLPNVIRVTPQSLGRAYDALAKIRETCQP